MTLFLDEEQVRQHLRMEELITAMEKALINFSAGKVTQPVRSVITVDPPGGFFGMMPALSDGLGIKIVTFYPTNAERGIPTHMATIFIVDPKTGAPLAILDGVSIRDGNFINVVSLRFSEKVLRIRGTALLVNCLRLRSGENLLETRIASQRIPFPPQTKISERDVLRKIQPLDRAGNGEQTLDQRDRLFLVANERINQREICAPKRAVKGVLAFWL
jgi:hypothetical protein